MTRRLVLATRNRHKLREYGRLLGPEFDLLSLDDIGFAGELAEPATDYVTNARSKAESVAAIGTDLVMADDSGIEVLALNDWPGANSARWLGGAVTDSDRTAALWQEASSRCSGDLRARYVCVIALAGRGQETEIFRGECLGTLVAPRPGAGGFGYDPIFCSDDLSITFSQATDAQKDAVSHRRRAVDAMLQRLPK